MSTSLESLSVSLDKLTMSAVTELLGLQSVKCGVQGTPLRYFLTSTMLTLKEAE